MRRRIVAALSAAIALAGIALVAPEASANTTRTQTTDFRCSQTLYSGTYQPAATSVRSLTYSVSSAPIGGNVALSASFAADPLNGPLALTSVATVARVEFAVFKNGAEVTGVQATGANSVPQTLAAFGPVSAPQPAVGTYPLTGAVLGDVFEFIPVAFRVDLTGGDSGPSGGSIRCVAVDAPNSYAPLSLSTLRTAIGTAVPMTGVPGPEADRCEIPTPASPPCATSQEVEVTVTAGKLKQRMYVNTNGSAGAGVINGTPPGSTPNVNTDANKVNLGTLQTPLVPTLINGNMNDITVTDSRGGILGWTLSATMTNFAGGAFSINNGKLTASPTCVAAVNAAAWDYNAVGKTAVTGYDDTLNAPGVTAGAAAQPFSGTVNLCTKSTAVNPGTGSTGGIYNITSPVQLTMPAFQAAAKYTATMTITLA